MPFGPPSNLTATVISDTRIDLAWSLCANGIYQLVRWRDDFGNSGSATVAGTAEAYSVTGLTPGTRYFLKVRIFYSTGEEAETPEVSATTTRTSAPTAPSNVTLTTVTRQPTMLDLSFTDNSADELGFTVELTQLSTGTTTFVDLSASSGTGTVSTRLSGLARNEAYSARVLAFSAAGNSAWSLPGRGRTSGISLDNSPPGSVEPDPVQGPYAVEARGITQTEIAVTWLSGEENATGHRIYVYLGSGTFTDLVSIVEAGLEDRSATVEGLSAETTYTLRMSTWRETLETFQDGYVVATTLPRRGRKPDAPTDCTAIAAQLSVALVTGTVADTSTQLVKVYRTGVSPSVAAALVATVSVSDFAAGYQDTGLTPGDTYKYHLIGSANGVDSDASDFSDDLVMPAPVAAPSATIDFSGIALSSLSYVLSFAFPSGDIESASLEWNDGLGAGGPWTTLEASLDLTLTSYLVVLGGEPMASTVWFRLSATNASGTTTAVISIDVPAGLAAAPVGPLITRAVANGPTRTRLDWVSRDVNTFQWVVRRRLPGAVSWTSLATVALGQQHYDDSSLTARTTYEYSVLATNEAGSGASETVTITTDQNPVGSAPLSRRRDIATFARSFGKDDTDSTVGTVSGGALVNFRSAPADASTGPFADLYVDGSQVSVRRPSTGESIVKDFFVEDGIAIEVRYSGTSTSFGEFVMQVHGALR